MKTLPAIALFFCIAFSPFVSRGQQESRIDSTRTSPDTHSLRATSGAAIFPGAVAAGAFSIGSRKDSIGSVQVGSTKTDSVTVTNTGTSTLTVSSVKSSLSQFAVGPASASIPAGTARKFGITFTPTGAGALTSVIVFTHNGPTSPDTMSAYGTGTVPAFSVNRKSIAYGFVVIATGKTDSVLVTNTGTAALVITSVTSSSGRFTVSPSGGTIQPGAKSTFRITYTPSTTNTSNSNIVFQHNAPNLKDTVVASGTGTGFSPNRRYVAFGNAQVGSISRDSVVITNAGAATLTITGITSSNGTFAVSPSGASIAAAGSAKFYITFTPGSTSPQAGSIVFTHSSTSSPDTVAVTGTGTLPGIAFNRKTVPFGTVALGSSSMDSVTVTDTGSAPLVISSITPGNGTFTVSPANATIQPAQSKRFYVTFKPVNTTPQSAGIVFNHNAPSLHDTVAVSGTGGAAGFSLNKRTILFGSVAVGGSRTDSVAVTDTGKAQLVISGVTSGNGRFTVNPASAAIDPGGTKIFIVVFTPPGAGPQNGVLVFNHNAPSLHDTVALSGTGVAPLPAPALLAPADGSTGQAVPVALSWNNVPGAGGYWLQIATDHSFTTIVLSDSTLGATGRQVSGLPQNTQYFWRVSTRNDAGAGPFSSAWSLTTLPSGPVTGTVGFSGDASSSSYRMFGLPGVGSRKAGDLLSGTQKIDWRVLRDNGKDTTYPAYYVDLSADSALRTGEGYWLLQRKDLIISRTDTLPPLSSDGTYSIPLHSGWNMISNPFTASVQRSAVIAANGLPAGTLFWEHAGSTRTSSGTTLDPFKGYYFDNDTANIQALKIPYPFAGATGVAKLARSSGVDWRIELVFDSEINTDRDNYLGIAPAVASGRNELDQHEPPLVFDQGFLYFVRPEWDALHSRFATDMRGALGTGQTWDFEVWNPRRGTGKITLLGLEGVPAAYQVVLVNAANSSPVDMRRMNVYSYQTSAPKMQFTLIVGTKGYVQDETSKLAPRTFELAQNYPNPFNPSTTISYMVPSGTIVRLEIFSAIGQSVRVLDEGYRAAATYSVVWDGKDEQRQTVSSGVYFCRLIAGGSAIMTRKLVLLR